MLDGLLPGQGRFGLYEQLRDGRLIVMEKHSEQAHGILQTFISDGTPAAIEARYASLPAIAAEAIMGILIAISWSSTPRRPVSRSITTS